MKLPLDKYYTSEEVVNRCWEILKETINMNEVTEIIESSAGAGAWIPKLKEAKEEYGIDYKCYDILPEHEEVIKQDFLELKMDYKPGRLIGWNPPFGRSNNLSRKFYNKAVGVADYIAFIQPISQLDNTNSMYYFDLVKSVDLGKTWFTDRYLHCCFNIYVRPAKSVEAWREKYGE